MNLRALKQINALAPGLALCGVITALAFGAEALETAAFGRAWLESLVLAILLGSLLRTTRRLPERFAPGIQFGAKTLLELAVLLLGVNVSAGSIIERGPALVAGIAGVVMCAIICSYAIGRAMGLPSKMAALIACGNSICGNSAIAAVAPVIDADGKDVAAAIAFTAVLGVVMVLVLPLAVSCFSLNTVQYGVFAGLTVYAVPQVLAATASVSSVSVHIGTLVKLVRVLMLGPVVFLLSLVGRKESGARPSLGHMLPWFIVGFLILMGLRSFDLVPHPVLAPAHTMANCLTIMSMAALGLGVDARAVLKAGGRVTCTVVLSLLVLGLISLGLIALLRLH